MSEISSRDLFLAILCALVFARFIDGFLQSAIAYFLRPRSPVVDAQRLDADLRAVNTAHAEVVPEVRAALNDVQSIQEGAFLAGWREAEVCRSLRPESEEHALHHFHWRDAAVVAQKCARAGISTCLSHHPAHGASCIRTIGHAGAHVCADKLEHEYWHDEDSGAGRQTPGATGGA